MQVIKCKLKKLGRSFFTMLIQNSFAVRLMALILMCSLASTKESVFLKKRLRSYYYDTKCLRPLGQDNGASVELVECSDYSADQIIKPIDFENMQIQDGYIQFNLGSKCVTLDAIADDNGVRMVIWDCRNNENQKWRMVNRTQEGVFQLQLKATGKCLTAEEDGQYLEQWDCNAETDTNQWWIVDTVTSGKYLQLENVNRPDHCLLSTSFASKLQLSPCGPNELHQIIALTGHANSDYSSLEFTKSRSCLGVPDQLNGTLVTQMKCVAGQANQNWRMEHVQHDGSFRIRNEKSFDNCLTNKKGEVSINMYTCTDISSAPHQYWKQHIPHIYGVDQPKVEPRRTERFRGRLRNYAFKTKCVRPVGDYNDAELELVQCSSDKGLILLVESFYNMSREAAYIQFDVSRKCISLRGFGGFDSVAALNGIPALAHDCIDKDSQKWKIINGNYEDSFQLQLKQNGKCLTAEEGTPAYVHQWDCLEKKAAPHQSWTLDIIAKLIQ